MTVNHLGFQKQVQNGDTIWIAPLDARFEILEDADNEYVVRFTSVPSAAPLAIATFSGVEKLLTATAPQDPANASAAVNVREGTNYVIDQSSLRRYNFELLSGADYGVLTIPFKLQYDDASLTAGATLGPYFGYHQRWLRIPSSLLFSAGLTAIPTRDVNSDEVATNWGLTISGGIIFRVVDQFQIGLVTGIDHLGGESGKRYEFEDKGWVSFAIGYNFVR